jgi:hypothetical protein
MPTAPRAEDRARKRSRAAPEGGRFGHPLSLSLSGSAPRPGTATWSRLSASPSTEPSLRIAPPPPPPRTNRTSRVPHPVLIGHAASLTCVSPPSSRTSPCRRPCCSLPLQLRANLRAGGMRQGGREGEGVYSRDTGRGNSREGGGTWRGESGAARSEGASTGGSGFGRRSGGADRNPALCVRIGST